MKATEFCYWLQGFFELSSAGHQVGGLTAHQAAMIKKHLDLVFKHEIDPSYPTHQQEELNAIHAPSGGSGVINPGMFDGLIRC